MLLVPLSAGLFSTPVQTPKKASSGMVVFNQALFKFRKTGRTALGRLYKIEIPKPTYAHRSPKDSGYVPPEADVTPKPEAGADLSASSFSSSSYGDDWEGGVDDAFDDGTDGLSPELATAENINVENLRLSARKRRRRAAYHNTWYAYNFT